MIEEVKAFGKTLGIEPTDALRRTSQGGPSLSMLWLWMQREGTLALRGPVDIRLAIGLYRGRMTEVARRLGIGRSTLYRKLSELGIDNAA